MSAVSTMRFSRVAAVDELHVGMVALAPGRHRRGARIDPAQAQLPRQALRHHVADEARHRVRAAVLEPGYPCWAA